MTITQLFKQKYNITARPGRKVKCPSCGKKKLAINNDDTIAKYSHSKCGKLVISWQGKKGFDGKVNTILEQIRQTFREELLSSKDEKSKNAYEFLKEEKINPKVIRDSFLGVVPSDFELKKPFENLIKKIEKKLAQEKGNRKGKRGRPPKKSCLTNKEKLSLLQEIQHKFAKCIKGRAGWLCYTYTDQYGRITGMRFREPYAKSLALFKPFAQLGIFGLPLFGNQPANALDVMENKLLVVKNELDQLGIQSLSLRQAKDKEEKEGYVNAIAVGSIREADFDTVKDLDPSPIICFDNDKNGASQELIKNAKEIMSFYSLTIPEPCSKLNDFFQTFDKDHPRAWLEFKKLQANAKIIFRGYEGVAKEILEIRKNEGENKLSSFEKNSLISKTLINYMKSRGKFYQSKGLNLYYSSEEKKLIAIDKTGEDLGLLMDNFGFNQAEGICNYLYYALIMECMKNGQKTEVHKISFYNPETFTLYLSNRKNQIYRISPETIKLVDNGTDGVLFLNDRKAISFKLEKPKTTKSLLDKHIISQASFKSGDLKKREQRLILTLWFYSIYFESIMPTKPILVLVGEKGSGKTTTMKKIGKVLYDKNFNVMNQKELKDFDAAVCNSHFLVLDNLDKKVAWLDDKLATVATGGTMKIRALYSNYEMLDFPVKCFLAITTKKPKFNRDDVADRLLLLDMKRCKNFSAEEGLLSEFMKNKNCLMYEIVHSLQEITRALKKEKDNKIKVRFRMADFADFSIRVARYAGIEKQVKLAFKKLTEKQIQLADGRDPVLQLIWKWGQKYPGKEITPAELCKELTALAEASDGKFIYRNKHRAFCQKFTHLLSRLRKDFDIDVREAGGHKKYYAFIPKKKGDDG